MTEYKTIKDLGDLNGKVVMLRADLNVPMDENFNVTNTARIDRTVPTIKTLMEKGAKVVVISHFGRPEGKGDMKNSLSHIVKDLEKALGKHVVFVDDCIGSKVEDAVKNMKNDEVLLLENLRFYNEEKKGDENFAKELVKPADVYVSDAFSTAHRAHASMVAAAKLLPSAMGLLMEEEVNALSTGLNNPVRPLIAIVGGSKVSTKLDLLNNLVKKVNKLVISGGMAHTFMKANLWYRWICWIRPKRLWPQPKATTVKSFCRQMLSYPRNSNRWPSIKLSIWNIFRRRAGACST